MVSVITSTARACGLLALAWMAATSAAGGALIGWVVVFILAWHCARR